MAVRFKTFAGMAFNRLKDAAKENESFLNMYKVIKKRAASKANSRLSRKDKIQRKVFINFLGYLQHGHN